MTIEQLYSLTKGERFVVNWQFDIAGSFNETLALAFAKADDENFQLLMKGFPEEGEAMNNFFNTKGWWENVENKIGRN